MMTETGDGEHKWNFEHRGDEAKADIAIGAATALTAKIKELFAADGIVAQMVEKAGRTKERGPNDFVERRRRPQYLKFQNGNESDDRTNPLLAWIFALLLIILVSVGVALHKLSNIEQGQDEHERRISRLERPAANGTPRELAGRDL